VNRRQFLHRYGAAAGVAVLGGIGVVGGLKLRASAEACSAARPPGVQLFTIRDALQRSVDDAFAALAAIGIREVEPFGVGGSGDVVFGLDATGLKSALERHGLTAPVAHLGGDFLDADETAELAHALGVETLVLAIAPDFTRFEDGRFRMVGPDSLADVDRLAEQLNEAGAAFRAQGLGFAYHNHHVELLPVEGELPLDRLLRRTDPELVKLELDVGWTAAARQDPVEYLERYAGRVVACHLKDFDGRAPLPRAGAALDVYQRRLVAPGAGSVDFERVLAAMNAAGVRHGFIEIDVSNDPFGAIGAGHAHLQRLERC
jgi:sugar phosphate isomerase/epimerase